MSKHLPTVLILTPAKDAATFLPKYFENLYQLSYPRTKLSLGFIESDSQDQTYAMLQEKKLQLAQEFRRVTLLKEDFKFQPKVPRWSREIQYQRRSTLAKSRNRLLQRALHDEEWVLWMDVDLSDYPHNVIQQLLETGKEIVVPHCVFEQARTTFDKNTFLLNSAFALEECGEYIIDGLLQPPGGVGRFYLEDVRDQRLVQVDGVGGTMLLIRADIHREGLIFPTFSYRYHIETEGLALMAKDMGYSCWGLPQLEITHGTH